MEQAHPKKEFNLQPKELAFDQFLTRHMRKIGNFIAHSLKDTGITPNMVSTIAFAFQLTGCVLFSFGTHFSFIIGSICLLIFNYLDFADGSLARLANKSCYFGKFLDETLDEIGYFLITLSLAIGCISITGNRVFYLMGFIIFASDMLFFGASRRFKEAPFNQRQVDNFLVESFQTNVFFKIGRIIYPIFFYRLYLILIFAIFNIMPLFMYLMALYSLLVNAAFILYVGLNIWKNKEE